MMTNDMKNSNQRKLCQLLAVCLNHPPDKLSSKTRTIVFTGNCRWYLFMFNYITELICIIGNLGRALGNYLTTFVFPHIMVIDRSFSHWCIRSSFYTQMHSSKFTTRYHMCIITSNQTCTHSHVCTHARTLIFTNIKRISTVL